VITSAVVETGCWRRAGPGPPVEMSFLEGRTTPWLAESENMVPQTTSASPEENSSRLVTSRPPPPNRAFPCSRPEGPTARQPVFSASTCAGQIAFRPPRCPGSQFRSPPQEPTIERLDCGNRRKVRPLSEKRRRAQCEFTRFGESLGCLISWALVRAEQSTCRSPCRGRSIRSRLRRTTASSSPGGEGRVYVGPGTGICRVGAGRGVGRICAPPRKTCVRNRTGAIRGGRGFAAYRGARSRPRARPRSPAPGVEPWRRLAAHNTRARDCPPEA